MCFVCYLIQNTIYIKLVFSDDFIVVTRILSYIHTACHSHTKQTYSNAESEVVNAHIFFISTITVFALVTGNAEDRQGRI